MKSRPILFNDEMVRAIIDGRKTVTRRPIKPDWWRCLDPEDEDDVTQALTMCPFGVPGAELWVREAWAHNPDFPGSRAPACLAYRASGDDAAGRWTPSIHMPRWASRITLLVTGVRIERVQDITEADVLAEGTPIAPGTSAGGAVAAWLHRWDRIYAAKGLGQATNPWVWVVRFERVKGGS